MIEKYNNVMLKKVKKKQLDTVIFNQKLVREISLSELKMFDYIFFTITNFLYENKEGLKSRKLYGRVTDIREKSIQINFCSFFPKSQILKVFKRRETIQTQLLKLYEG